MPFHPALLYTPILVGSIPDAGGPITNPTLQITVKNADGSPFTQLLYTSLHGVTPVPTVQTASNGGYLELYCDRPQSCLLDDGHGTQIKASFTAWEEIPYWYEDVRQHGASTAKTPSYNAGAIQEAVDTVISRGGGRVIIPEQYSIDTAIHVIGDSATIGKPVILEGIGSHFSGLIQTNPANDVVAFGDPGDVSLAKAAGCGMRHLVLRGGNRGLSLDNAIWGCYEDVKLYGNRIGLMTSGQCEKLTFNHLWVIGSGNYGILLGYPDGGSGFQETQKCIFTNVMMQSLTPSTALCGIYITGDTNKSGDIIFDTVSLEDGPGGWIYVEQCFDVTFRALKIEESGFGSSHIWLNDASRPPSQSGSVAAGYSAIIQGPTCARFTLKDSSYLPPTDNANHPWRRVFDQQGGVAHIENCSFIWTNGNELCSDAAIYLQGSGATIIGGQVNNPTQIKTIGQFATQGTLVLNMRESAAKKTPAGADIPNSNNLPITNYNLAANEPQAFVAAAAHPNAGFNTGTGDKVIFGTNEQTLLRGEYSSLPTVAAGGQLLLGPTSGFYLLFDISLGKTAVFVTDKAHQTCSKIFDDATTPIVTCNAANTPSGSVWSVEWTGPPTTGSFEVLNRSAANPRQYQLTRFEFLAA